jgi:multiple sugar transport system substrate-binding protein
MSAPNKGCSAPTLPQFWCYNPAYAQVEAEHVWGQAMADIMANGMAPQTATDKAFRRLDAMFADYLIHPA